MNRFQLGLLTLLSTTLVSGAFAAETVAPAAPEASAPVVDAPIAHHHHNWNGLYGAALVGYNFGSVDIKKLPLGTGILRDNNLANKTNLSGIAGGVELGGGTVFGKVFVGASFSAVFSGASKNKKAQNASSAVPATANPTAIAAINSAKLFSGSVAGGNQVEFPELSLKTKIKNTYALVVQLGAPMGRVLPYLELGCGWTNASLTTSGKAQERNPTTGLIVAGQAKDFSKTFSKTSMGISWGLGVKAKISDNLFGGLSFRQVRANPTIAILGLDIDHKVINNTVMVSIGYLTNVLKRA